MHGGSHRHLDCFQVQPACSAEILKDETEQPAYFALDFPPDRFRRFFPAPSVCLRQVVRGRSSH
jgi:hypothetical protein